MKISILIPAFNAENTIEKCIDTISSLSISDKEIIVVNDGSTDGTLNRLNEIKDKYNLTVIEQSNQGVSIARNRLIDAASGDYILFCDADDFIDPDGVRNLYDYTSEHSLDVCVGTNFDLNPVDGKVIVIEKESRVKIMEGVGVLEGKNYLQESYNARLYSTTVPSNLWRTSFLKDNKIKFIEKAIYEDVDFTFKSISKAKRVSFYNSQHFYYVLTPDSITRDSHSKIKKVDFSNHFRVISNLLLEFEMNEDINSKFVSIFFKIAMFDYFNTILSSGSDLKEDDNIKRFSFIVRKYGLTFKERIKLIRKLGLMKYIDFLYLSKAEVN